MGGVVSEGGLEGWKMQKHVQANVEDRALVQCNVSEKQMQMIVEVRETSTIDLATIKVDMQKNIEMIVKQKNVIFVLESKEDEHVIGHVEIDLGDIFNFNLQFIAHPSSVFERMGGFFLGVNLCL